MTIPTQAVQNLINKIQTLPVNKISEVEDFVDFLRERARLRKATASDKEPLDFPVDNLGPWPERLSLHREDMYGDDGR